MPAVKNPRQQREREFQRQVLKLATLYGWLHYHPLNSIGSQKGFPDLTLVKGTRLIFAELKRDRKEKLKPSQRKWAEALRAAGQDVRLWTPEDWPEIEYTLAA